MAVLGLRKSSVVSLNTEDFDFQNQRIFIEEKGLKSKRPMVMPVSFLLFIEEYIYIESDLISGKNNLKPKPLFLSGRNRKKRLRADAVDKIVTRIKQALLKEGHQFVRNLSPHIFRHSAATELNDLAGSDQSTDRFDITREMLGHRNEQNTRKYIHLSPTSYGSYMKRHPYFKLEGGRI